MDVPIGALESTLPSYNIRIRKLESLPASKDSELDLDTKEAKSAELRHRFAEDEVSLIAKQVQSRRPLLPWVEAALGSAGPAQPAAKSNVQSLSASECFSQGNVGQIILRVGELEDQVARMRQNCNCKVEDVLF